ncbi:MAG: protease modulator HflC [Candidatus Symbiodolus clandestinus]
MNKLSLYGLILSSVGLLLASSLFVVQQGERAIIHRFGEAKRDRQQQVEVFQPGLHCKIPVIDQIKKMDARIQLLESHADRFITNEKKDVIVDSYVKWRITDFAQYYRSNQQGDRQRAQLNIKAKISDRLRSEVGNRTIKDIVSGSRGELMEEVRNLLNQGKHGIQELGIQIVDVRIKQINLPPEVSNSIYQRMQAERSAVAREHRSQGEEQAAVIRAEVDRRVEVMLANAERKAQRLRGKGDAAKAELFSLAFGQHMEFYQLIRQLKAYEKSLGSQDLLVMQLTELDYWRYLPAASGSKSTTKATR